MQKVTFGMTFVILAIAAAVSLLPFPAPAAPDTVNDQIYADLLTKYVQNGVVDYSGFKRDEALLDQYLEQLSNIDPQKLDTNAAFAFYTNAYNAWTIKLILSGYPGLKSIKDLGSLFKSPWKKKFVRLNGDTITLDKIEHEILRPRFKDPRVHFAINCASKSCPPLISQPYRGATLDQQLDAATRAFINDGVNVYVKGDVLYVSKIFDWFEEDFDGVVRFVERYAQGDLRAQLQRRKQNLKLKHLDYDWSLNGH